MMEPEKGRCLAARSMFSMLFLAETLNTLSRQGLLMLPVTDQATEAWRGPQSAQLTADSECLSALQCHLPYCYCYPPFGGCLSKIVIFDIKKQDFFFLIQNGPLKVLKCSLSPDGSEGPSEPGSLSLHPFSFSLYGQRVGLKGLSMTTWKSCSVPFSSKQSLHLNSMEARKDFQKKQRPEPSDECTYWAS